MTEKYEFCGKNPGDDHRFCLLCRLILVIFTKFAGSLKEGEKIKANERLMLRENWELYYYWMIRYLLWYSPERQIVIPTIRKIMEFLTADYIPYTVVYPERERKEEYEGRYRNRGDSESFWMFYRQMGRYAGWTGTVWEKADCVTRREVFIRCGLLYADG